MLDSRSRSAFLLGAATNWLAFAATLAVSFFLTPFFIQSLGRARYDVWCVVESVLAYFTLLDMGIAACLVRYVAKHHAEANRDGLNRIVSSCLVLFLAAGGVAMLVGVPLLFGLSSVLQAKLNHEEAILPFMLLMLANLSVTLPLSVFPNILDGLERFSVKSAVRLLFLAVRSTALVLVLNDGGGLMELGWVYTACNLAEHSTLLLLSFRFLPGLRLSRRLIDRETLKQIRTYSTDAFLAMLAGRISLQTGAIVIGLLLPAGNVTFYVTAARLIDYAKSLLRQITTTLTPGVSAMEAKRDFAGIKRLFLTATRWVLYFVLPIHVGLILFGKPFLSRWVGVDFVEGSFPSLVILSATLSFGVAQSAASRVLYGMGKLKLFARLALADALLNVVLMFALIPMLGVIGVAVAVAVPNLLFCIIVIVYTSLQLGVSFKEYTRMCLRPLFAVLVPLSVWFIMGTPAANWGEIATHGVVGMVCYVGVVAFVEMLGKTVNLRGYWKLPRISALRGK